MSLRKLRHWHEQGLIDDATFERISEFESQHARPLLLWAAVGIGALTIGLGIISLVAANWEDVPGQIRLGLHMLLLLGLGAFLALRADEMQQKNPWVLECGLFILAVLGLTFFGHLGQVYQTSSPLWKPLAAWLLLFGPLMLWRGQSWLVAALFLFGSIYACWDYALNYERSFPLDASDDPPLMWLAIVTAFPVLFAPLAGAMRQRSQRQSFWFRLEQMAFSYAIGGASIILYIAAFEEFSYGSWDALDAWSQLARAILGLVAGAALVVLRRGKSGEMAGVVVAGAGLACILAYPVSGSTILSALLFFLLWGGIAAAALRANWRGVFQLAVVAIALRLISVSFELASDLLLSGFGLIVAGILILVIAWAAVRVSKQFAPERQQGEG